jgi:hypothetical protein
MAFLLWVYANPPGRKFHFRQKQDRIAKANRRGTVANAEEPPLQSFAPTIGCAAASTGKPSAH